MVGTILDFLLFTEEASTPLFGGDDINLLILEGEHGTLGVKGTNKVMAERCPKRAHADNALIPLEFSLFCNLGIGELAHSPL